MCRHGRHGSLEALAKATIGSREPNHTWVWKTREGLPAFDAIDVFEELQMLAVVVVEDFHGAVPLRATEGAGRTTLGTISWSLRTLSCVKGETGSSPLG